LLSALFVNDTICLMFTPMVLAVARDVRLNPVPFLIALATASNIGSVMTLTGNPQNMLVGIFSKWPYGEFFVWMLPIGFVSLWLDVLVIYVLFRQDITRVPFDHLTLVKPLVNVRLVRKVWLVLIGVLLGFLFIGNLPLVAIVGGVAIGIIARKPPSDALEKVDWDLLLFFCGLFIVVAGINKSGVVESLHSEAASYFGSTAASQIAVFSAFSVLVSNIVSNVPFVMLAAKWIAGFANPKLMWFVLAMSSTFAGNFTIVGSVANMIVMELSKDDVHVGFWQFFKVGATITALTTAVGVALCIAYSHLGLVR
ncbi:MAG: anion transporter, partial [Planctomycetes bacterium]|nr:anion transporter [Planctomycetota bacterium]